MNFFTHIFNKKIHGSPFPLFCKVHSELLMRNFNKKGRAISLENSHAAAGILPQRNAFGFFEWEPEAWVPRREAEKYLIKQEIKNRCHDEASHKFSPFSFRSSFYFWFFIYLNVNNHIKCLYLLEFLWNCTYVM